jgi:hypothetical protein
MQRNMLNKHPHFSPQAKKDNHHLVLFLSLTHKFSLNYAELRNRVDYKLQKQM